MADTASIKTYRYLRIGIVGTVLLLGVSVALERMDVSCWQPSISSYYYTPVRAVFVGALMAIGLALIVIKGGTMWEDACLNAAGMLAPVVALAPTSDTGRCFSIEPIPLPKNDAGELAPWVVANIDNNIRALLIAGVAGMAVALVIALVTTKSIAAAADAADRDTKLGLAGALVLLVGGAALYFWWDQFDTRAHGYAALLLFVALIGAVAGDAWEHRNNPAMRTYFLLYGTIAALMLLTGVTLMLVLGGLEWDHRVLVLEIIEIVLFAAFWVVQTKEHWTETI